MIVRTVKELEKTIEELAKHLAQLHEAQPEANTGACILTPSSGSVYCVTVTPNECAILKGNYVGGKCPS
jgi:hypothetical protein